MDPLALKRIKQVCFEDNKQAYEKRKNAINASSYAARVKQEHAAPLKELSPSDSVQRLKNRSLSRNQRIEEKLLSQSTNQIKRQPTQNLKQAGVYRTLRQSQPLDATPKSFKRNQGPTPNDSTVLHGSPEKSFFNNMRYKSASRSHSRSQTGQSQSRKQS